MAASITPKTRYNDGEIEEATINGYGESFDLKVGDCISFDHQIVPEKMGQVKKFPIHGRDVSSVKSIAVSLLPEGPRGARVVELSLKELTTLKKIECPKAGGRRNKKSRRRHRKSKKGTRKHR